MTGVYELSSERGLILSESPDLPETWPNDPIARWVRMVHPAPAELESRLRPLDVSTDLFEAPHGTDSRARAVALGRVVSVALPVLVAGDPRPGTFRAVCTRNTLVTVEDEALAAVDDALSEHLGGRQIASGMPDLFLDVLQAVVRSAAPAYLSLRQSLDDLSESVEERPLEIPTDAMLAMKRRLTGLSTLWEDQAYSVVELQRRLSRISDFDGTRDQQRDLVADTDRRLKLMTRMEARLVELRAHHQHCLQERTNGRLNVLAVLSSIYMPPTLIAGIYGMNFEGIPIAHARYGYFLVMALMATVVIGQTWYFSRRGWFK